MFLLVVVVFCLIAWYGALRIRYEHRIRKIGGVRAPGVGTNPFIGAVRFAGLAKAQWTSELLDYYVGLFKKISPTCHCVELQVSPDQRFIFTEDPEHIKVLLTTNFDDYAKGQLFNKLWHPFLGDGIFTTDGSQWHESRNLMRPMFLKDRLSDLQTFDKWFGELIAKLPPSGQTVDILDMLHRMTLDVTTDYLLGACVNSLDNPQSEFAHAFEDVQRISTFLTAVGPFHMLVPRRRYYQGVKKVNEFVMPYIEQALALPKDEVENTSASDKEFTFLHRLMQYTQNPTVLRDQIVSVLLAGRDTTAATLAWAFYELCHYPEKYQKLRREVIDTLGRNGTPSYTDLKDMKYLRYVLNETLRIYPAVPFNIRTALKDTLLPGAEGQPPISVVEGDTIIFSVLAMQRRKDLYPPISEKFADPAVFSPERWEHWTPRPWYYIPFNGGPRICIGQNFALTEMALCLVRIVQKYERIEYRGDWHAQKLTADIVGTPTYGVPMAFYEENTA